MYLYEGGGCRMRIVNLFFFCVCVCVCVFLCVLMCCVFCYEVVSKLSIDGDEGDRVVLSSICMSPC